MLARVVYFNINDTLGLVKSVVVVVLFQVVSLEREEPRCKTEVLRSWVNRLFQRFLVLVAGGELLMSFRSFRCICLYS